MEALIQLSLYDERWLLFGLPSRFGFFSMHTDIKFSNLFYLIVYFQIQFLGAMIFQTGSKAADVFPIFFGSDEVQEDPLRDA